MKTIFGKKYTLLGHNRKRSPYNIKMSIFTVFTDSGVESQYVHFFKFSSRTYVYLPKNLSQPAWPTSACQASACHSLSGMQQNLMVYREGNISLVYKKIYIFKNLIVTSLVAMLRRDSNPFVQDIVFKKLSMTYGWAEVLSMAPIVPTLNRLV